MIVDKINEHLSQESLTLDEYIKAEVRNLAGYSFERQFMSEEREPETGKLWISSLGSCPRQVAYKYHAFPKNGKKIDARSRMNFWIGDLTELMIGRLAKLAGCPIVGTGLDQVRVELKYNGSTISGRPDGLLIINPIYLVEVKAMPSYKFRDFERSNWDKFTKELCQINAYMSALNLEKCVLVAFCKDTAVLSERVITKDDKYLKQVNDTVKVVVQSTKEELPERAFKPDKGQLPWQCLYCAHWGWCYPEAELVFDGKRNQLKLKEKKC